MIARITTKVAGKGSLSEQAVDVELPARADVEVAVLVRGGAKLVVTITLDEIGVPTVKTRGA